MRSLLIIMLFLAVALSLRAATTADAASSPILDAPAHASFRSQVAADTDDDHTVGFS